MFYDSIDIDGVSRTPSIHEDDDKYEWNDLQEETAVDWANTTQYYSVMHERSGKYFMKLYKYLGYPAIILPAIMGTSAFGSLTGNECDQTWVFYFVGFLGILSTILGVIHNFSDIKRISKHFAVSGGYESLYKYMVESLSYSKKDRINVKSFFRHTRDKLKTLKKSSPDIPEHILNKYIKDLDTALVPSKIQVKHDNDDLNTGKTKVFKDIMNCTLNKSKQKLVINKNQDNGRENKYKYNEDTNENKECVIGINYKSKTGNNNRNLNDNTFHSFNEQSTSKPVSSVSHSLEENEMDLQDEFAAKMKSKINERQNKIRDHHLNRLEITLNSLKSEPYNK